MVVNDAIAQQVRVIAESVASAQGVEFVHCDIHGAKRDLVVRIYIDNDGAVTLDDCARFSGAVEAELDLADIIPGSYVLEVSSPGIERELYSIGDFERFAGNLVRVRTKSDRDGQRNFSGEIVAVEKGEIVIEDKLHGVMRIPYSDVAKANLKMDLGKELKGRSAA
jgi:ribosome maturation factor RimP